MGWASFLGGAMGYVGNRMEQDRQIKLKQQLEEAQQKREMFLDQYKSNLEYTRQSQLQKDAAAAKDKDDTENFSHSIQVTNDGVFGYNPKGESKKLRELSPGEQEERNQKRKENELEMQAKQASIANSTENTALNRKYREAKIQEMQDEQERKAAIKKETPEEKNARKLQEDALRLVTNRDFATSVGIDPSDPEASDKLAQAAAARIKSVQGALNPQAPVKADQQKIIAEINDKAARLKAMGVPVERIQAAVRAEYIKYGLTPP